ncbi:hypothetical protein OG601_33855 [Streptomyces sp. NBC_01239]|uniref:hypothetical protein n=1 Tax=Streptomyces sp. NBC_01239 TaxID=2903792 RepID=UPI002253683B|nr:hypothetical protein [Streptomyces sp. NBC_01239]MCX4815596.1 hypothetical protein [Streptomyces sp. NBC_01239]
MQQDAVVEVQSDGLRRANDPGEQRLNLSGRESADLQVVLFASLELRGQIRGEFIRVILDLHRNSGFGHGALKLSLAYVASGTSDVRPHVESDRFDPC